MTILIFFLAVVFTVAAVYSTISPLVGGAREKVRAEYLDEETREIEVLVARREVLLASLRELEFEFETSKIAQTDYEKFRRRYEREAVHVMKRLDELHGGRDWESRVEDAVAERLGRRPRFSAVPDDREEGAA